ncbi:RidA family protein [Haloferax sp. YSMS24]|uniref:RidA family protein n=1 Tax=Haloferax sp. YSMS24 TaxID=3388425 RepID=UPI00398CF78D
MDRQAVNPDGLVDATSIGYSQAVVANGTFYMSGQVGWDETFTLAGDDIESQTRQAFENVDTLLSSVEQSLADVAKVTAHIVDPHGNRDGFFEVWHEVFTDEPYPCLTILGPQGLAQEGFLVELEVEVPFDA